MSEPDEKTDPPATEGGAAEEGKAGHADPSQTFRENPPDEEEQKEIDEERERRLDPDNRPEGAEVDNTGRTFDQEAGEFEDGEGGGGGLVDPTVPASERRGSQDGASDTDSGDDDE